MPRALSMTLLLLVILFGGWLLLTSSPLLSRPLISIPFIPVGTVTTWLMLMALPLLGRLLLHGPEQPYKEEMEQRARHAHPSPDGDLEGETAADVPHPLWRLASILATIGLVCAVIWPFVSYVLAGSWSFSFSGIREISALRFGLFVVYSIFTFLCGFLSLVGSFRPR